LSGRSALAGLHLMLMSFVLLSFLAFGVERQWLKGKYERRQDNNDEDVFSAIHDSLLLLRFCVNEEPGSHIHA
jgi:hypothetical protein